MSLAGTGSKGVLRIIIYDKIRMVF